MTGNLFCLETGYKENNKVTKIVPNYQKIYIN